MASEYDGQVVTLQVEEGNKPGQPIATYVVGRRERYLVFLPGSAPVGQEVRVKLADTGSTDKRGSSLFRGVPAEVEYTERWKDNGDGTASRVTIATNWLFQESEEGVVERRPFKTREGVPDTRWEWQVVWGSDHASTKLLRTTVRSHPQEQECVSGDALVWQVTGHREEREDAEELQIGTLSASPCGVRVSSTSLNYDPSWSANACFSYLGSNGSDNYIEKTEWGKLPSWLQNEYQARYPVCACGRERRDTQVSDGYGKCELCRAEEHCERCGKQTEVAVINSRLVCDACKPYETAEQLIAAHLTDAHRQAIADEARKLLLGRTFPQAEGEVILRATADHIPEGQRDAFLRKYAGYGWYYFCEEGIYRSKLAPAALAILEFLPQAAGNGLVEMVAWFASGAKLVSNDYYLQTQVEGKQATPVLTEDPIKQVVTKLEAGQLVLVYWLRGSEGDRQAALAKLVGLKDHPEASSAWSQISAAEEMLTAEAQDYRTALQKLLEAEAVLVKTKQQSSSAGVAIRRIFSVCCLCGEAMEEASSYPEEAKFVCRNVNKHPAEGKVVFDRSNSGLTEYEYSTLVEWTDRKGPKFHRGRTIAVQMYVAGGEVEAVCHFYPDINLDEMAKFDRRAEAIPAATDQPADDPPAVGQSQFGEDAALPDMAEALRQQWGAK